LIVAPSKGNTGMSQSMLNVAITTRFPSFSRALTYLTHPPPNSAFSHPPIADLEHRCAFITIDVAEGFSKSAIGDG
jgi:hypothetical protein